MTYGARDMMTAGKQGNSKRKEPWYWVIGKPRELSDDAWELECKYFLPLKWLWKLTLIQWIGFAGSELELHVTAFERSLRSWMQSSVVRTGHSQKWPISGGPLERRNLSEGRTMHTWVMAIVLLLIAKQICIHSWLIMLVSTGWQLANMPSSACDW